MSAGDPVAIAAGLATKGDLKGFERRLTVRMGAMFAAATAVAVAGYAVFG